MMKKIIPFIIMALMVNCSRSQDYKSKTIEMQEEFEYSPVKENVHQLAKNLMIEDFYFSSIDETSPFGSDDASDTYAGFAMWRRSNKTVNTIEYLNQHLREWDYPVFDMYETDVEKLKPYLRKSDLHFRYLLGIDQSIIALAFGQLYLEGKIDNDILKLANKALARHLTPIMLSVWPENYQNERKEKLLKMQKVILELRN